MRDFYIHKKLRSMLIIFVLTAGCGSDISQAGKQSVPNEQPERRIDRQALVRRHNPLIHRIDSLSPLSLGNGEFALTLDITGLQSFPEAYRKGIPLGAQSSWGWHTWPNPSGYSVEKFPLTPYDTYGRQVGYLYMHVPGMEKTVQWLRSNPHRLQLGQVGFRLEKADGRPVQATELTEVEQSLDLWSGILTSRFTVDGITSVVETACHPEKDLVSVRIKSDLIRLHRMKIQFHFPYSDTAQFCSGARWDLPGRHRTDLKRLSANRALFTRILDQDKYYVETAWSQSGELAAAEPHLYFLTPAEKDSSFELVYSFSPKMPPSSPLPGVTETQDASRAGWVKFWSEGGAVDLSGSRDPRAGELERRIVLSQYLTAIQCAGSLPPQETGLVLNSWAGKFHLEMHWWHATHFALWGRTRLIEKSLPFYGRILAKARHTAKIQGYAGARWPKCVDHEGVQMPCFIEPFLIWQQPHPIYYAELCYRANPDSITLKRYRDIVFETADFMASFAHPDKTGRYVLGPPVAPGQEVFDHSTTFNPAFELAYWRFGLETAQKWRERLGQERNPAWDRVLKGLSALPVHDSLYVAAESAPNTFSEPLFMTDHPLMLGALGFLPENSSVDRKIMHRTLNKVLQCWDWSTTWGWDYPLIAMTAARLGETGLAVDALLMDTPKNHYLPNGHCFQTSRLPLYLPANGGLLSAVAMMCAGWDGTTDRTAPGFPSDGSWTVRWEGLKPMP